MQILALFFFLICACLVVLSFLAALDDGDNGPVSAVALAILAFLMFEIGKFILGGCG